MKTNTNNTRDRIKRKIRMRISGTAERPRFSVFRSNKFIYAQLIDDTAEATLVSASDLKIATGTKTERAQAVGKALALAAVAKNISSVVFDRNGYKYTGRVKLVADAARENGLQF